MLTAEGAASRRQSGCRVLVACDHCHVVWSVFPEKKHVFYVVLEKFLLEISNTSEGRAP